MFQLIIVANNSTANAQLSYLTKDAADIAQKNIHDLQKRDDGIITAKDDFGAVMHMPVSSLSYTLLIDVAKQQELIVEREIATVTAQELTAEKYKGDMRVNFAKPPQTNGAARKSTIITN